MLTIATSRRGSILILLLLSIITIAVVIAFGFLRSMQMSRSITLVQRKDDLARLAAEMGLQHALAVCIDEYAMPSERRDDQTLPPVARLDGPSQVAFAALSRFSLANPNTRPPQPYDLGPDAAFNDLYNHQLGGVLSTSSGPGFQDGTATKPGYARWIEANRFSYDNRSVFDPATYDDYDADAAVPDPSVVSTRFPPVDPFVRGAALTKRHAGDNPLLLDADLRPVLDVRDARYRLRYAIDVQNQSGSLWLNSEMPWITPAELANVRRGYAESINAVGIQLSQNRAPSFTSVFMGYGAVGNSMFNNGQPQDWPTRGGQRMYYRDSSDHRLWERSFHSVHGNAFMTWNDPGGQWIGSAIGSFNDLSFATQGYDQRWHQTGEVAENQDRVRGDKLAQFMLTPFGRQQSAGSDHPWAVDALTLPPRVLEALVAAYMPPVTRSVRVTHELCSPWVQTAAGPPAEFNWGSESRWEIPPEGADAAQLTVLGVGTDLFTENFEPKAGIRPFSSHPAPPDRDYWHTLTVDPLAPNPGLTPTPVADTRLNAERYPGPLFFSSATHETEGQRRTRWRAVGTLPRQIESDPTSVAFEPKEGVDHVARHIVFYKADPGGAAAGNGNTNKYLSAANNNVNWSDTIIPALPFSLANGGPGKDGRLTPYSGMTETIYEPSPPVVVPAGEKYPPLYDPSRWSHSEKIEAALTPPADRNGKGSFTGTKAVTTISGWRIRRSSDPGWSAEPRAIYVNSYFNRLALACYQAIAVAQQANLAWTSPLDTRSMLFPDGDDRNGVRYTDTPDSGVATYDRKGPGSWDPKAIDFATVEQLDRQFLANLGESFDQPGRSAPTAASSERPPRYVISNKGRNDRDARPTTYRFATRFVTAEYAVTNNIRTLLTPFDASAGEALTPLSTAPQIAPPHRLWLLDEWDVGELSGLETNAYVPGTTLDAHPVDPAKFRPTHVARVRAMLMERVLNDFRLSFFGSEASYVGSFRPKDFDGDGIVWCSGYAPSAAGAPTDAVLAPLFADPKWGLPSCWRPADANGNGPAVDTPFSVTGCFTINPSRQFKIHVRGELYDNFLNRAVAEQTLQGALLVDPDGNVTRGPLATGLDDSTLMLQRPIRNYYEGLRNRSYP